MQKEILDFLSKTEKPVYVFGGGEVANLIKKELEMNNIRLTAFIVDYLPEHSERSRFIESNSSSLNEEFILVRGFLNSFYMSDEELMTRFPKCLKVITIIDMYEASVVEPIEEEFYMSNKARFDNVRKNLFDDISTKSFDAFIATKIFKDNKTLLSVVEKEQYFFEKSPWEYSSNETYLDCGAYTGDSINDFIEEVNGKYKRIIAIEPDSENYKILNENIKINKWENITTVACGIYEKRDIMKFNSTGDMEAQISQDGEIEIEVDSIDNIVNNQAVSIIKMDIEGTEMSALKGAERTILKNRPILMISAYHKKTDLFEIYEFVSNKVNDYVFFFRCHKPLAIDAVLYAVPKEKIKK